MVGFFVDARSVRSHFALESILASMQRRRGSARPSGTHPGPRSMATALGWATIHAGQQDCRNNARIRARELKPSFYRCACLTAAQSQLRKEEAHAPSGRILATLVAAGGEVASC